MEEVTGAGHIHGDAGLTSRFEHFLVANGTARLNDSLNACIDENFRTIREWEERVGCSDSALGAVCAISQRVGAFDGQVRGIDTIHLTHANANSGLIVGDQDSVRLDTADGPPSENQILDGLLISRLAGNQFPSVRIVARSIDKIRGLHQQTAVDLTELRLGLRRLGKPSELRRFFFLGLQQFESVGIIVGSNNHLG